MTRAIVLSRDSDLYRRLQAAATERRCVFFAGLPGVGKSLLIQQTALLAAEATDGIANAHNAIAAAKSRTPFFENFFISKCSL